MTLENLLQSAKVGDRLAVENLHTLQWHQGKVLNTRQQGALAIGFSMRTADGLQEVVGFFWKPSGLADHFKEAPYPMECRVIGVVDAETIWRHNERIRLGHWLLHQWENEPSRVELLMLSAEIQYLQTRNPSCLHILSSATSSEP